MDVSGTQPPLSEAVVNKDSVLLKRFLVHNFFRITTCSCLLVPLCHNQKVGAVRKVIEERIKNYHTVSVKYLKSILLCID